MTYFFLKVLLNPTCDKKSRGKVAKMLLDYLQNVRDNQVSDMIGSVMPV
jgi:hypothetical protein